MNPHAPSLSTASPAEGQRLARVLANDLLAALPPAPSSMPEMMRTGAARPDPAVVAAIYFHAISLANAGWQAAGANRGA